MNKEISLKELNEIAEKVLSKDFYPKKLPNGMWEIAKGIFTNEKGLKRFYEVLNQE